MTAVPTTPELFDAGAHAAGFQHPAVRLGSMAYHGRILSAEQWAPHQACLQAIGLALASSDNSSSRAVMDHERREAFPELF